MKILYFTLIISNFFIYNNSIFAIETNYPNSLNTQNIEDKIFAMSTKTKNTDLNLIKSPSQSKSLPQFNEYNSDPIKYKKANSIDLKSHKDGTKFKTVLSNGFKGNINFANHFIIISHGCGTMCQQHWVVDAIDGKIKDIFQTSVGVEFKNDSNLLILNPLSDSMKDDIKYYKEESNIKFPLWKGDKTTYLLWNGKKFQTLNEIDIYNYFDGNIINKSKEDPGLTGPSKAFNFNNKLNYTYSKDLLSNIQIGPLKMVMENTSLNDIKNEFGGEIQHSGDASSSVYWICYKKPTNDNKENLIWFISNGEMGGSSHDLTGFAMETMELNELTQQCNAAPTSLANIKLNIPTLGNNIKDLKKSFKDLTILPNQDFIFYSNYPYSKDKNFTTQQSISYSLKDNIIVKIGITQITSN